MASSNAGYSYTTQGSDELREILCEQCDLHGSEVEAVGFCVDCVEYMCKTCLVYHMRYMPAHTQQDAHSMPKDLYVAEKCPSHSKLRIKFFCQNCEKLACSECKVNEHKDCGHVSHISMLASSDENKRDIGDLQDQISDLTEDMDCINDNLIANMEQIPVLQADAKHEMKTHAQKMVKILLDLKQERVEDYDTEIRELEETLRELRRDRNETIKCFDAKQKVLENNLKHAKMDMKKKMEEAKNADQMRFHSIEKQIADVAACLKRITSDLERNEDSDQKCSIFIAIKKSEEKLKNVEEDVEKMKNGNKVCRYKIEPKADSFTYETVDNTKDFFSYKEIEEPKRKEQIACFDSHLPCEPVNYTSLCFLKESKLLIADHKYGALFMVEHLQQDKQMLAINMPAPPWGIAKVNDEKIVVSFPELGKVCFLTLSEAMSVVETTDVKVGYDCYGVAYGRGRLIVSYLDPAKVQILDTSGKVLRCFENSPHQTPLFRSPRHILKAPNKRLIYVSDSNKDTVTALTFTGKVKDIYTDDQLVGPFQLTTDREGSVYVCGRGSNNIHQISSDFKKIKILLDENHGLMKPVSVAFCEVEKKLYIGMYGTSAFEVFKLKQE